MPRKQAGGTLRDDALHASRFQAGADGVDKFLRRIGLLEKIDALAQRDVLADEVGAVTGGENDLEFGIVGFKTLGKLAPRTVKSCTTAERRAFSAT